MSEPKILVKVDMVDGVLVAKTGGGRVVAEAPDLASLREKVEAVVQMRFGAGRSVTLVLRPAPRPMPERIEPAAGPRAPEA